MRNFPFTERPGGRFQSTRASRSVTETLLVIHVLAAAAWLGGGFLNGFVGPRMAKAGGDAAIGWMRVLVEAAGKFFLPAALVVLLSGILLVTFDDAYDWSMAFVGIGLAVAVIGNRTVARTFQCADPDDAARIGPDRAFEIGSVSKTMTAALLADLIRQGKGSLDDPLSAWLPPALSSAR